MKHQLYNILCADLETQMCGSCSEFNHSSPDVWLAGFKFLYSNENYNFICLKDMFLYIMENISNPLLYFHYGGKFDTFYIYEMLISTLGFWPLEDDNKISDIKPSERKHFSHISADNINYEIKIYYKNNKLIIRDSYRLIPLSIQKLGGKTKGKFNDKEKYAHIKLSNISDLPYDELEKFNEDIDTMRVHLQADLFYGAVPGLKRALPMTIASLGFKTQIEKYPFIKYNVFNQLTIDEWDYLINFFRGGIVWTNPLFLNKIIIGIIKHYDVNSLYPFILKNENLPLKKLLVNKPLFGSYTTLYKIFIKTAILKKGKLPYIGIYKEDAYIYPNKILNLTYHCFDFELDFIKEQYEIEYSTEKINYMQTANYLRGWIEENEELKIKYTITGDEVNRNSIKLLSNSGGFGKYGQHRKGKINVFKWISEEEKNKLRKNSITYKCVNKGYFHFTSEIKEETNIHKIKYCPVAAYVTAKARIYISRFRQQYLEWLIYGDTDDMYLLNKDMDNEYLDIFPDKNGNSQIGKFGLFSYEPEKDYWEEMFIHGSKKYWIGRKDKKVIKFAGFVIDSKNFDGMNIEEFSKLNILKGAKTQKKYFNGKPIIFNTDGILRKKKKE